MPHKRIRHVTCVNGSCQACEWVMSKTRFDESCHTRKWGMSHMWMSHVTHVNGLCHTCGWVMSHVWTSHVTHVNDSESLACHKWVMSRMGHVTNGSCHKWVTSQMGHVTNGSRHERDRCISDMWMSAATRTSINESCPTCERVMSCVAATHCSTLQHILWKHCFQDPRISSMAVSGENAISTCPKSTKSRNSDSPVSRCTNSYRDVGSIRMCSYSSISIWWISGV